METTRDNPAPHLTPRQLELLKEIATFNVSQCYSPTIGELASKLHISRSTAFEHIDALRKKGFLSASPGKARSLKITSKAQKLLKKLNKSSGNHTHQAASIRLVGNVAAGVPIEAIEDVTYISTDSHFGISDEIFALNVKGDSMIDEGIYDGDSVICRKASIADNGQLVIAIVDNENATLKRFYKEKNRARLQPANDNYQPIYSDNCRIDAVVVGLIRKY